MNAAGVLHHHADRFPERVAVGFDGEVVTYAGLVERAAVTAGRCAASASAAATSSRTCSTTRSTSST